MRNIDFLDSSIIKFDKFIKYFPNKRLRTNNGENCRNYPAKEIKPNSLNSLETNLSSQMMRVNHSGEVCAQALYLGQAIVARDNKKRKFLLKSAKEEKDHLTWCNIRLQELNSHTSFLNPIWFVGSFGLGTIAGLCGDKWSMGFLAETEYQVTAHLEKNLNKISSKDKRSIAIIKQMRDDELKHATGAIKNGGEELPKIIKDIMRTTAKIMTYTAKFI